MIGPPGGAAPRLYRLSACYENERLPFNAFDGAIDLLAGMPRALPAPLCEALMPKRAALLAQLFPVLSSVPAIANAPKKGLPAEPSSQKQAALECLLALLNNLSAKHELLFVVDALQWADDESFALLDAMVAQHKQLPCLFVCTVRPEIELSPQVVSQIARLRAHPNTVSIVLPGLSESAAKEVARAIYGTSLADDRLQAVVRESKGHPLFLRELVGQLKRGRSDGPHPTLALDVAVREHIASLPAEARQLLTMVALAGRPLGAHLHARAMDRMEVPREALITLLEEGLLQMRGGERARLLP